MEAYASLTFFSNSLLRHGGNYIYHLFQEINRYICPPRYIHESHTSPKLLLRTALTKGRDMVSVT
jgi:hypothetical protein